MLRPNIGKPLRIGLVATGALAMATILSSLRLLGDSDDPSKEGRAAAVGAVAGPLWEWLDDSDEPGEGRETQAEGRWPLRGVEQRQLAAGAPRCAHTADGAHLLVDEEGFVCPHRMLGRDGCCNGSAPGAAGAVRRHDCERCDAFGCCDELESCISCCLAPRHRKAFSAALSSRPSVPFPRPTSRLPSPPCPASPGTVPSAGRRRSWRGSRTR